MRKWQKVKMATVKKNKVITYIAYLCPKCDHEALIQTNYCPDCGKKLRRYK